MTRFVVWLSIQFKYFAIKSLCSRDGGYYPFPIMNLLRVNANCTKAEQLLRKWCRLQQIYIITALHCMFVKCILWIDFNMHTHLRFKSWMSKFCMRLINVATVQQFNSGAQEKRSKKQRKWDNTYRLLPSIQGQLVR